MKIGIVDLECTNLDANFGRVLCGCIKELGKPIITLKEGDFEQRFPGDDKELCEAVCATMSDFDMWVTWYGAKFDIPFLRTRLIINDSLPLPKRFHLDMWYQARYKFKLNSNRLDTVADSLEVTHRKTKLLPDVWRRAQAGEQESLLYIVKHCEMDVRTLEDVYQRLKRYVDTIRKG